MNKKLLLILLITILSGCSMINTSKEPSVRIKWLGNAGFLIESNTTRVYINPYSITLGSLKGDGIIISSSESASCDPISINSLTKDSTIIIAPPACAARLASNKAIILSDESSYKINDIVIKTIKAGLLNNSNYDGVGFIISVNNITIYYAGITDLIPQMNNITNIDVLITPIAGNHLSMNMTDAIELALMINPRITTIPMYYGGNTELITDEGRRFQSLAEKKGINVTLLSNKELLI